MENKDNIQRPFSGLVTDTLPIDQPKESYSYALNALNETRDGENNFLSMENAIKSCDNLPSGSSPVGSCYMYDDNIAILLSNGLKSYIGIINKYNKYEQFVETTVLNLSTNYPVNATFRFRRNSNRVIYWVDGYNIPRLFNFDRPEQFYSSDYNNYLETLNGGTDVYADEKWEVIQFDLIKRYNKIPIFDSAEIINSGNTPSGSYSISIQLVDASLSPTEWITTSNPVNIYISSLTTPYEYIRGSRNTKTEAQNFSNASKSIKWKIGNLDDSFAYYRVAVLIANQNDGNVNQALVSGLRAIDNTTFIYSGNNTDFTETPLTDIYQQKLDIANAKYIEQLENRLILASVKGTQINWCEFQKYASQIKSEAVTKTVQLADVNSKGNTKNPTSAFDSTANMWDEVYSYGIVYVVDGGLESPAFHIPGKPSDINNTMGFYECTDGNKYINTNSCLEDDYWGIDGYGNALIDTNIRHHRFPKRTSNIISNNNTESKLLGIKFTNIIKPHPDIIGFKIVRNERLDDDKLIVDNVIIGPLTCDSTNASNPYHSFGLLLPDSSNTKKSTKGAYIFSPEHQFYNKSLLFDEIEIIGTYTRNSKYVPSASTANKTEGSGAYVNDVSPGTSYNPEYHKEEDPDGFDLQIMYRINQLYYSSNSGITLPPVEETIYLPATGSIIKNNTIFFNASTDNKIIAIKFPDNNQISNSLFNPSGVPRLLYASLKKNNTSAYSGFASRPYYKEHNNVVLFNGNVTESDEIYNGDCYTSAATILSTTYHDTVFSEREKKSKVWKIIVGGILIIAGIAGAIFSGGTSLSLTVIGALSLMALSYGVSMVSSGIQFEVMKKMIDVDYEAGLKDCIEDNDNQSGKYYPPTEGEPDDRFEWFTDRLQNVYFESSVNISLRSGLTAGITDFINSPSLSMNDDSRETFEAYLINKMTVIDREQGDGRLYIGYPTSEFYDMNLDFLRKNQEKIYNYLPLEYDCCSDTIEDFKDRIHYSEQSYQEETLDNFRVFLPNNYRDIESNTGKITNIFRYNNALYIHTSEALYHLPQNLQEKVTNELVTFIGTGEFFAIPPRKISDGTTSVLGSTHHQATQVTKHGVFFISASEKKPYLFNDSPKDISTSNRNWFKNNLISYLEDSITENIGKKYVAENDNVYSNTTVGIHSVYDERNNRMIVTKIDYKPLFKFSIFTGNNSIASFVYNIDTKEFGVINHLNQFTQIPFINKNYFENKSWTMSYSFNTQTWVSWHSYLPRFYVSTPNNLYSFIENDSKIYLHNFRDKFCNFYGVTYPFIVEVVSVSNPVMTRIWNHLVVNTIVRMYHPDYEQFVQDNTHFFEIMTLNNDRQLSGAIHLKVKSEKENPEDYLLQQVQDSNYQAIVNRVEDNWFINDFRDYIVDKTKPLFSKLWQDIRDEFPIDKVINTDAIDLDKDWTELESFNGKYLTIRLAYYGLDSDNDIQIIMNYLINNEQPSIR